MYINPGIRAEAGWIETKRTDKAGRVVKAKDHVVASQGMHSADEMEKIMREVAKDVGADESQIRISTFQRGEAPIEANPRHRSGAPRKFYSGFGPGKR